MALWNIEIIDVVFYDVKAVEADTEDEARKIALDRWNDSEDPSKDFPSQPDGAAVHSSALALED